MGREDQIIEERLKKLKELRKDGINPYPYSYEVKNYAKDLQEKYAKLKAEEKTKDKVKIAGRLINVRDLGKIAFGVIADSTSKIQFVLQDGETPSKVFEFLKKYIDSGDFIGVEGVVFRTKRGELSVLVNKIELLSKSTLPLPDKFYGLQDKEERYRKRYLDLIMSPEVRDVFAKREKILDLTREFLKARAFHEIDTPYLQTIYGGAAAKPFQTHLNALNIPLFLAISPELYLKRLIVGGYDKVFTIARNFRNEGIDRWHNPEFTMMEIYWAYTDYTDMMSLQEDLFEYICKKINGSTKITIRGTEVDFKKPWKRVTMADAIKKSAKIDVLKMDEKELREFIEENKVELKGKGWGWYVQSIFEHFCEKDLIQPTFIIDHPRETTPLCKIHRKDERLIERFEAFCMGTELSNAYSELNDPMEQRRLLEEQQKELKSGNDEANPYDEDFVNAIEIGMPPTSGIGIGIDRMVILLTGQESIRDVIMFPFMKPETKADAKIENKEVKQEEKQAKSDEKVIIDSSAKKLGLKTAYAIIEGVKVSKSDKDLDKLKKNLKAKPNKKRLEAMQKAYLSFGVDSKKRAPSSEALLKRLEEGKGIYSINTLVDAYNISSVNETLPMAAYDLSKIDFPIVLRKAREGEKITLIGGDVKKTKEGEIIYSDESKVLCLDFNYRDCDETKITDNTKEVIIFADGCLGIEDKELLAALDECAKLIIKFNGGKLKERKIVK